jgi:hypothetical protein
MNKQLKKKKKRHWGADKDEKSRLGLLGISASVYLEQVQSQRPLWPGSGGARGVLGYYPAIDKGHFWIQVVKDLGAFPHFPSGCQVDEASKLHDF